MPYESCASNGGLSESPDISSLYRYQQKFMRVQKSGVQLIGLIQHVAPAPYCLYVFLSARCRRKFFAQLVRVVAFNTAGG
jgi:hypothetical protein